MPAREDDMAETRARIGLIIPSSNRLTEPHFNRYAPDGVETNVTRLRMTGPHRVPVLDLLPKIAEAAEMLADARCDVIVFHCTASSTESGRAADARVIDTIRSATGTRATTTGSALLEALGALEARRLVALSPYMQEASEREIAFLAEAGLEVVRERSLNLTGSDDYLAVTSADWLRLIEEETDPRADAYLLSCTNIRSLEIVEAAEHATGKPVVASNQATLWTCLRICGLQDVVPGLGRLFELDWRDASPSRGGRRSAVARAG
jgi:maleate isomerase